MAQSSGPISQGTTAERQFSDALWRDIFGDESGVIGDMNGTAYALVLPSGSDVAQVGSGNQLSTARVAGFGHRIPAGAPESITIPVATGAARTDIISLRYDPASTGAPGPVRLFRIAGTTSALPVYDDAPPGTEDLPLWAVTRSPGQNLSQATVTRLFPRLVPTLELNPGSPLPINSPLGTVLRQGSSRYRRQLDVSNVPAWTAEAADSVYDEGAGGSAITTAIAAAGDMATVTVPAGVWDVDYRGTGAVSVTSARTFRVYLFVGSTQAAVTQEYVGTLSATQPIEAASFVRITTTAAATVLSIRYAATATGGTQNASANSIRARRAT